MLLIQSYRDVCKNCLSHITSLQTQLHLFHQALCMLCHPMIWLYLVHIALDSSVHALLSRDVTSTTVIALCMHYKPMFDVSYELKLSAFITSFNDVASATQLCMPYQPTNTCTAKLNYKVLCMQYQPLLYGYNSMCADWLLSRQDFLVMTRHYENVSRLDGSFEL